MISVCTVIIDKTPHIELFYEWILRRTKLVKEVLLCKIDAPSGFYNEETIRNIKFKTFGTSWPNNLVPSPGNQHSIGLHACIDMAVEEYIMCCDPDVFAYPQIDEFYIDLIKKYEINIIGVSHHAASQVSYRFFPCVINCLIKKSTLPGTNWMKNKLKIDGKYLLMNDIEGYIDNFPAPKGNYDVGSYLWLWAYEQKWKWLSFQTTNCKLYTTKYYRNNFKLRENLSPTSNEKNLLYHAVSGTIKPWETDHFIEAYRAAENDQ